MAERRPNGLACRRPSTVFLHCASFSLPPIAVTLNSSLRSTILVPGMINSTSCPALRKTTIDLFPVSISLIRTINLCLKLLPEANTTSAAFRTKIFVAIWQIKNPAQISRQLKRLRLHGLIKKIGRTYKYYLTSFGKQVIATGLKLKQLFIIPQLVSAR